MADMQNEKLIFENGIKDQIRITSQRHDAHTRSLRQFAAHARKLSQATHHLANGPLDGQRALKTAFGEVNRQ